MPVAIFDLDNTLLRGDSDHAWGLYLADRGAVDSDRYAAAADQYLAQYEAGVLDIDEFLAFQLAPLARHDRAELERWRDEYMRTRILPMIFESARELVAKHRNQGHVLVIITATNSFITRPIAEELGIDQLIATEPAQVNGRFTGQVSGIPCFREGKVTRMQDWLDRQQLDLVDSWFYSDSHNDLPLLLKVDHPVAVNPDDALADYAHRHHWPVLHMD